MLGSPLINNNNNNNNNRIERRNSRSPHCAANCLQHVRSNGPGANMCKSRAAHRAFTTCNMPCATWYEGTAQLLSVTELKPLFVLLAEQLTDEGGEETGVPGENPRRRF